MPVQSLRIELEGASYTTLTVGGWIQRNGAYLASGSVPRLINQL